MASNKTEMSDKERAELVAKLDKDLEEFTQQKIAETKKRREEAAQEDEDIDIDELAEELKQHPAFMTEFDPSKPLSEAAQGLQAMMYESEDADGNAENYKEDGNKNFKLKKYRWAVDNYTEGIKCKPRSKELNAVLHCNRAAAQFHIGNFRSSLNDAIMARKFKPDHMKAILRGISCCMELKKYKDAVTWCDSGLLLAPEDKKLLDLRVKADKCKKQEERDKRKALAKQRKEEEQEEKLIKTIQDRGIRLAGVKQGSPLTLSSLESQHPSRARVFLDVENNLHWPVMFLYPEYGETDFITAFNERDTFMQHLMHMFSAEMDPPPWDEEKKYVYPNIQIYYEDKHREKLHHISEKESLSSVLSKEWCEVQAGTPAFILLIKNSAFAKSFLQRYSVQH